MKGVKIKAFLLVVDGRARCHALPSAILLRFFFCWQAIRGAITFDTIPQRP